MQMYKVMEAIRIHHGFPSGLEFDKVIEVLKEIAVPSVRSSYNVFLDMEDDVLACVVAVDGLFLLNLLCSYGNNKEVLASSSSLRHLVKISQRRLAQETTIQVAMMLQNQIPIFVLKFILFIECWKEEYSDQREIVSDLLPRILLGFCEFVSPLKTVENYPLYRIIKHSHLLDLLYHLVTLKQSREWNPREEEKEESSLKALSHKVRLKIAHLLVSDSKVRFQPIDSRIIEAAKKLAPAHLKKPIDLVQGLLGLPFSQTKSSIYSALKEQVPEKEAFIPRASELHKAGVKLMLLLTSQTSILTAT